MQNPSQEPPAPTKAPNQDLKDMDVLCTFKIKIESQNLECGCIKNQWPSPNQDQYPNSSQELPASSKFQKEDLKDMDVLCTFRIKIEHKTYDVEYIINLWPNPNQDQDNKIYQIPARKLQQPPKSQMRT